MYGELKFSTGGGPSVEPGTCQLPGLLSHAPLKAAHVAAVPGVIGDSCRPEASSLPEHRATCFKGEFLSLAQFVPGAEGPVGALDMRGVHLP